MHAAERLYLSGYMTYPRTESTKYPDRYDYDSVIISLTEFEGTSGYSKKLAKVTNYSNNT